MESSRRIPKRSRTNRSPIPKRSGRKSSRNRSSITEHDARDIGYTVDTADLLFTPRRHYLVNNNGHKVWADELEGKSIVLFIFPLSSRFTDSGDALDMIQVYNELSPMGDVEFIFVPVHADDNDDNESEEDIFFDLFHCMPFPAIPLSDIEAWDGPLMRTFGLDRLDDPLIMRMLMPYWVVIDPSHTVVFTRFLYPDLFNLFGGAELHPLSNERIWSVVDQHRKVSRQERINKWDQLLASPHRDYLLSSEGNKVPVSSLKGKVIGLYFCDNVPYPPSMNSIHKVYEEAKLRGLDFEIVQINFPWHSYQERYPTANPPRLAQCPGGVSWLTLPFKDPRSRKLQRIIPSVVFDDEEGIWGGDCLVIIDARRAADTDTDLPYEFSGAEIISEWGIEGYPFTRPSLFDIEYKIQNKEVTLQSLFPPGERLLQQSGELVDASKLLSGKRVLVFFSDHAEREGEFVSMLKSVYSTQKDVAEEDKFEVIYVSTHYINPSPWRPVVQKTAPSTAFKKFLEGMPWLAHPDPQGYSHLSKVCEVFRGEVGFPAAAAFNRQGELIAKADSSYQTLEGQNLFPFVSSDLETFIRREVNSRLPFREVQCYLRN